MFVRRRTVKMTVVNMLAELPLVAMAGARMLILNLLGPLIMMAIIGLFLRHPLVTVASIHMLGQPLATTAAINMFIWRPEKKRWRWSPHLFPPR